MRSTLLGVFLALLAATGACGKKGPLYLPEQAPADAAKDAEKKAPPRDDGPAAQTAPAASPALPSPASPPVAR